MGTPTPAISSMVASRSSKHAGPTPVGTQTAGVGRPEVIRVDRPLPAPPEAFLYGVTRVVLPPPIQEFLRTARLGAPRKRRDCVDDLLIGIHGTAASVADLRAPGGPARSVQ